MLHELLFALNGYDGDVFALDRTTKIVKVAKNLPFVHPSEESLLNRICILATHYIKFKTYIDDTNNFTLKHQGLYEKAFVRGLELVLEPYLKLLVELEKELMQDQYLSAAYVQCATEEYQQLFPTLSSLVDHISAKKVYGCEILDYLHKSSITGLQIVRDSILKILQCCHLVMYKQLLSWLLYGQLTDNTKHLKNKRTEFFIQHSNVHVAEEPSITMEEDVFKESESREKQLHEINMKQLPSYISIRVAQKILFIGQSVDLFRGNKKSGFSLAMCEKESIMSTKEKEFSNDVDELSKLDVFDALRFENVIDKIKTYVAEQLRSLMVDEADIQSNLKRFKDFFLIGRGELFLAFIDQSQHLLAKPPTHTTQHDVNLAFQHAARDLLLHEKLYKQFELVIQDPTPQKSKTLAKPSSSPSLSSSLSSSSSQFLQTRESGWNCLRMSAHVKWPLHIVFTKDVLQKYSSLFSFLLHVKRIQMELQHCWSLQMQQRHESCNKFIDNDNKSGNQHNLLSSTKWRLRNHMAFIVDNLQYYLQVDVIESQFSILLDKIRNNVDFEEILLAHELFLSSLLVQSFIQTKQVNGCLMSLLDLCHSYYGLVVHSEVELNSTQLLQLEQISKAFHWQSSLLFAILSRIQNNPHLTQLLLRVDFNRYFSKTQLASVNLTVPETVSY